MGSATRDAYGAALVELGKTHPNVVVLDADLAASTKTKGFSQEYPDRFYNVGISEANMCGMAGGLAHSGKIPFISSFACFLVCKGYDQLRMTAAYPNLNVKVVTSHGGISVGEDGVSQQSIEDVALMATLPNFRVAVPADATSTTALVKQAADIVGPVYIRTGRPKVPVIYEDDSQIEFGKGVLLRAGSDVTLVANGMLVWESLEAADALEAEGISAAVVDMHTVKPLDEGLLKQQIEATGALVTAEEHSVYGGLSAAVSQAVTKLQPVPVEVVAIDDTYAESGQPEELFEKYGLTAKDIVAAAKRAVSRKS